MPRNVPVELAEHLAGGNTTTCCLLKIKPLAPSLAPKFGMTTLDADVVYDDGTGDGPITYRAANGYTPLDLNSKADLSVDNSEASGLLAIYPSDGMSAAGIASGDYDCARFVQYLINYNDLASGQHVILSAGQVGQVTNINDQTVSIELRSLTQILKQTNMIELTSITDRARYGGIRNKMVLRWYNSTVEAIGVENDRDFTLGAIPGFVDPPSSTSGTITNQQFGTGDGVSTVFQLKDTAGANVPIGYSLDHIQVDGLTKASPAEYSVSGIGVITFVNAPIANAIMTWSGTLPIYPDGYFVPGVIHWITGANAGRENEVESYVAATGAITLVIPTYQPIVASDTFQIRRDSDKSKTRAIADNNLANFRGEPEIPRADGASLQAPAS